MSKLSPKERALLDAARSGWRPSASVTRAVRAGIPARLLAEPALGMDAPGPEDGATGRFGAAKAFVRSSWGAVTGLAVVGLFVFFGTARVLDEHESPATAAATASIVAPPRPALAPEPAAPREPSTVSLDSLPDVAANTPPKATEAPAASARPASPPTPAARPSSDTIAEEVALVRAAQRSLRDGAPSDALASLATHASRFPRGALREERMTLQVLAQCALGDLAQARSLRAELERVAPASSHLQRLSCARAPE